MCVCVCEHGGRGELTGEATMGRRDGATTTGRGAATGRGVATGTTGTGTATATGTATDGDGGGDEGRW